MTMITTITMLIHDDHDDLKLYPAKDAINCIVYSVYSDKTSSGDKMLFCDKRLFCHETLSCHKKL